MLTVRHDGLVHVPKHDRNIFVEGDDHWWNARCDAFRGRMVNWRVDQLVDGAVITCLWCLANVLFHKACYGQYPT